MVPPVRKTTTRGPLAAAAARRLPGPLSFRLVTSITFNCVRSQACQALAPQPCAPGNAGRLVERDACVGAGAGNTVTLRAIVAVGTGASVGVAVATDAGVALRCTMTVGLGCGMPVEAGLAAGSTVAPADTVPSGVAVAAASSAGLAASDIVPSGVGVALGKQLSSRPTAKHATTLTTLPVPFAAIAAAASTNRAKSGAQRSVRLGQ